VRNTHHIPPREANRLKSLLLLPTAFTVFFILSLFLNIVNYNLSRGATMPRGDFLKLLNRFTKKLMKLKEIAFNQRRQFKVEYVSHSPNLRRMQDGNPLHLKSIQFTDTYILRIREDLTLSFVKRVKRGPHSVRISNIVIVIAARRIKIVSIVSIIVVAGTQPGIPMRTTALKARLIKLVV